jgi:hypothetical protein
MLPENLTIAELKAVAAAISNRRPVDTEIKIVTDQNHVTVKDMEDVLITRIPRKRYRYPEETDPSDRFYAQRLSDLRIGRGENLHLQRTSELY